MAATFAPRALALAVLLASVPAAAEGRQLEPDGGAEQPNPFAQGKMRFALGLGGGSGYWAFGGGAAFFLLDGLEVGLDGQARFEGSQTLAIVGPEVRYVLYFVPSIKPYFGAFYRHWFIEGAGEYDTLGERAGVFWVSEGRSFVGLGVAREQIVRGCDACEVAIYPELLISISL